MITPRKTRQIARSPHASLKILVSVTKLNLLGGCLPSCLAKIIKRFEKTNVLMSLWIIRRKYFWVLCRIYFMFYSRNFYTIHLTYKQ